MQRIGFILKVKQELIEEYRQRHETVWPEMREALSRNGWHNYSLFMRDDGMLFGYFETPDSFRVALDGMSKRSTSDGNQKWPPTSRAPAVVLMRSWKNWSRFSISTDSGNGVCLDSHSLRFREPY